MGGDDNFTVTSALEKLANELKSGDKERPLRLIGSSTGALVAALYAERNRGAVDKVFLLAPTWELSKCLENFESKYGIKFTDAFREDAKTLPDYPTVTCPAYVVHGFDDDISPLDNSARWMQMASQWMRQEGDSEENVAEASIVGGEWTRARRRDRSSDVDGSIFRVFPFAASRFVFARLLSEKSQRVIYLRLLSLLAPSKFSVDTSSWYR